MNILPRTFTLLALALSMSACNSSTPPTTKPDTSGNTGNTTAQISADKISGTIGDKLLWGGLVNFLSTQDQNNILLNIEATVDTNGKLNMPLSAPPPDSELNLSLPPSGDPCTFSGTASNATGQIAAYAALFGYSVQGDPVGIIQETLSAGASVPGALVARVYADSDQKLQGVVKCPSGYTRTYDLNLKAGWNVAELSGNDNLGTFKSLSNTARSTLTVTRSDAKVGLTFADDAALTLTPGERVSRQASIYPIGGYSGTVKLSTNVPGLTVEPATLTIAPPVTAQTLKLRGWAAQTGLRALSGGLRAQGVDTTLTFVAAADAPDFSGNAELRVTDSNENSIPTTKVPLNVTVVGKNFDFLLVQSAFHIEPSQTINLPVTLRSINNYSGTVDLILENLPQGVTAQPKTVNLTGDSVSVNLLITASANAPIVSRRFTVTATAGSLRSQQSGQLLVYPRGVEVPGAGQYGLLMNSSQVDAQGNLWFGNKEGFVKITPNLVARIVNNTEASYGVTVGQDGGIWAKDVPYKRLDPVNETIKTYTMPDNTPYYNGLYKFDLRGRNWETPYNSYGIYRLDLVKAIAQEVPGSKSIGSNIMVQGSNVWVANGSQISKIDSDTLSIDTYNLPGVSVDYIFFPYKNTIYFVDSGKLATFSVDTGTVTRGATADWTINMLYGLDSAGNAWVRASRSDNQNGDYQSAILHLNASGNILRELPYFDILYAYTGSQYGVTPNGGLWFTPGRANLETSIPRVYYIAP